LRAVSRPVTLLQSPYESMASMPGRLLAALLHQTATSLVGSLMQGVHDRSRRNAWDAVCEHQVRTVEFVSPELEAILRGG